MANLIEQLSASQQGYQTHHSSASFYHPRQVSAPRANWPINLTLLLLPALVTVTWLGYSQYDAQRDAWLTDNQGKVDVIEQSAALARLPYPNFIALEDTRNEREFVESVDNNFSVNGDISEPVVEPMVEALGKQESRDEINAQEVSEEDLLRGLDFSGLSPEIAYRLQSAMDDSTSDTNLPNNPQTQDLTENADLWFGQLPPLNFQTHVYSSNEAKRWVKINDVEYKQGDQVASGLELIAIEPQACVIQFHGESIRIPALYDWQG